MKGGKQKGSEPQETMDSGKQTEGFRGRGLWDWDRPVMGIKEGTYCLEHGALDVTREQ